MNIRRIFNLISKIKPCLKLQQHCVYSSQPFKKIVPATYIRYMSSKEVKCMSTIGTKNETESTVQKFLTSIPFLKLKETKIKSRGYLLYEAIADRLNYIEFFEELDLPDTFYSWFVITELHIWMLSVRAMCDSDVGRLIRNALVEALWLDVSQRVKQLGAVNPRGARMNVAELSEQLQAAFIAYDEGIQSNDIVLSGALWRRLYQHDDMDLEHLELLIKYIRKQIRILDNFSDEALYKPENIKWQPIRS